MNFLLEESPFNQFFGKFKAVFAFGKSGDQSGKPSAVAFTAECQAVAGSIGVAGLQAFHAFDCCQKHIAIFEVAVPGVFFAARGVTQYHGVFVDMVDEFYHIFAAYGIHFCILRLTGCAVYRQPVGVIEPVSSHADFRSLAVHELDKITAAGGVVEVR